VTEFRYKAFISYSHQNQAWGKWLQRALEGYRVPRRLVGKQGEFGQIPARLSPVFRDREDLSSGADLKGSVNEELRRSESLIVICSPSAAASRYVNEEISFFRSLGRGNRIYALIVDGDPLSKDPDQFCFPTALIENPDGTVHEPLAADSRKWADGRHLSKLKLIAGILGIRLDDLRRRDMQRRHRLWMLSMAAAMTVTLTTSFLAVLAVTARNAAENRRDHAENLVGYMVGDLRTKLDEVGRLDILEGMGGQVSDYLETLNPAEVTDESLAQQARVWRQLGEVSMDQGKFDEAMDAFTGSREVLKELHRRNPDNAEWLYQLGNSEFWVGYVFAETGEFIQAGNAFDQYMNYASRLSALDPGNPEWLLEKGYAHSNLAALAVRQDSTDVEAALEHIRSAVEIGAEVLALEPDNAQYLSEYGEALAWLADTQLMVCDLGGALLSRQKNVAITLPQMEQARSNAIMKRRYAYSLTGLSNIERKVGLVEPALEHMLESRELLSQLSLSDPSNIDFRWEFLLREFFLAQLQAESDLSGPVLARLEAIYQPMKELLDAESHRNTRRLAQWNHYLLSYSDTAWRAGRIERASELMANAIGQLHERLQLGSEKDKHLDDLMLARFLYWQQRKEELLDRDGFSGIELQLKRQNQSCDDIGNLIRQAIVVDDLTTAEKWTAHLLSRGYFDPGFIRICRQYGLCREPG
jgi:tetratricopeptide (TPR) repeat protein